MIKKLVAILCAGFICITNIMPLTTSALANSIFNGNEEYYYNFCTDINLSDADQKTCDDFYDYLNKKNEELNKELANIQANIASIKKDITALQTKINNVSTQIRSKETAITSTQAAITKIESNIALLGQQIIDRESSIKNKDSAIRTRLASVQSIMRVNAFTDFIMGAKNFVDLIRRVEGVNDVTNYDKQQIRELEEQKELLVKDQKNLNIQKEKLLAQKTGIEQEKSTLVNLQKSQQAMIAEYNTKMIEWEAQQNQVCGNIEEVKGALKDLSNLRNLQPSAGWYMPIKKGYVSASAFYYPASFCSLGANKCPHLGTDIAASAGTAIYAPANAVILYAYDGCPTYGGLGDYCGKPGSAGGGNQVYMAMQVAGKTYAVKMLHMKLGSIKANITWPSKDGKAVLVQQGDKIGEVGSSGNSTGPHLHIEVFYFGTQSLESVVESFAKAPKFDFGLGFSSAGLATTCNRKKYTAPCRYSPNEIFNIKQGQSW